MQASETWQNSSGGQKIALIILPIFALGMLINLVLMPMFNTFRADEQRLAQLKIKIENISINSLDLDDDQLLKLIQNRNQLDSLLPEKLDALKLLRTAILNYERYNSDIEFVLLKPQHVEQGEMSERADGSAIYGPGQLPIHIELIASYAEMVQYFNYIENQDWILSIRSLEITKNKNNSQKLNINAIITIALSASTSMRQKQTNKINHVEILDVKKINFYSINKRVSFKETPSKIKNTSTIALPIRQPHPTFKIDGFWQNDIIIDGDILGINDQIAGWKIKKIDLVKNEVLFTKGQFSATLKVDP